jgi:hypothetical protein
MKHIQSVLKIRVHTTYSAVSQNMILQYPRLALEATKAYEAASTAEYKPNPPILIGKDANLH